MWSRSTKQRRAAMRRRALVAIAPFRYADIGSVRLLPSPPGEMRFRWTETPTRPRTAEEQNALYEQRGLAAWLATTAPTDDNFFTLDPRPSVILGPDATDADVEAALARTDTIRVLRQVYPPKEE